MREDRDEDRSKDRKPDDETPKPNDARRIEIPTLDELKQSD